MLLDKKQAFLQELLEESNLLDNVKFWLKFATGYGDNKDSSKLVVELPTCTMIPSKTLQEQIQLMWHGDCTDLMDAIPTALP